MLRPSRGAGRQLARHAEARTAHVLGPTHGLIGLAHAVSLCLGVIRPYRAEGRFERDPVLRRLINDQDPHAFIGRTRSVTVSRGP